MKALKSDLVDRVLRFDGVSEVSSPEQVAHLLLLGVPSSKIRTTFTDPDIDLFNQQVPAEEEIRQVAPEPVNINLDWSIPEPYRSMDLDEYMFNAFDARRPTDYTEEQFNTALKRIVDELEEVRVRGMTEFMRTVIYVLDTLRKNNVIWGVGRGSSCASYLLFIIGLHAVDCVRFDVPLEEFYHG